MAAVRAAATASAARASPAQISAAASFWLCLRAICIILPVLWAEPSAAFLSKVPIVSTYEPQVLTRSPSVVSLATYTGSNVDIPINGIDLSISGFGRVLVNLESSTGIVLDSFVHFVADSISTSVNWRLSSRKSGQVIKMCALSGMLVLQDLHVWTDVVGLEQLESIQLQPDLIQTSVASLDLQVHWIASTGHQESNYVVEASVGSSSSVHVVESPATSLLLRTLPAANRSVSLQLWSYVMLDTFPVFVWSAPIENVSHPMACPPGWAVDSSAECHPCPPNSFLSGWSISDVCSACPDTGVARSRGSSYCWNALSHWSFDLDTVINRTIVDVYGAYHANFSGPLDVGLGVSAGGIFGSGSLRSNGTIDAWLTLPAFDFFCSATMDCHSSPQQSWSIAFWFRPTSTGTSVLLSDWSPVQSLRRFLGAVSTGFVWTMIDSWGASFGSAGPTEPLPLFCWTHVTYTFDQFASPQLANFSIWINGTRVWSATAAADVRIAANDFTSMVIGHAVVNGLAQGFSGALDELWLFSGALESDHIGTLMLKNVHSDALLAWISDGRPAATSDDEFDDILMKCPTNLDPPPSYDSRTLFDPMDCALPARNQNPCGTCWAHAMSAVAEIKYCRSTGSRYRLSVQQLIDCAQVMSCNATHLSPWKGIWGQTEQTQKFYERTDRQLCSESWYPQRMDESFSDCRSQCPAGIGRNIRWNDQNGPTPAQVILSPGPWWMQLLRGYHTPEIVDKIKRFLFNCGPAMIAINSDDFAGFVAKGREDIFRQSVRPNFNKVKSCPLQPNHALALVGYTQDYWIALNSGGPTWGKHKDGTIFLELAENVCGFMDFALWGFSGKVPSSEREK